MSEATTKVLVSTSMILLSKKLFKDYKCGKDIIVSGNKINKFLDLTDVREERLIVDDMLVCFDSNLNITGIIKSGMFGYVMPITDSNSSFIKLYKMMPIQTKLEDLDDGYMNRVKYEMPPLVAKLHMPV